MLFRSRGSFKADLLGYFNELQRQGAIENFAGSDDIAVKPGDAKDAITVDVAVRPVTAMTKLYMSVMVH